MNKTFYIKNSTCDYCTEKKDLARTDITSSNYTTYICKECVDKFKKLGYKFNLNK